MLIMGKRKLRFVITASLENMTWKLSVISYSLSLSFI